MRNAWTAFVALALMASMAVAGCAQSASQRWRVQSRAYTLTVNTAADLLDAGVIDLDDAEAFDAARVPARMYLNQTAADILDGQPAETIDARLDQIADAIATMRRALPQGDNQ